MLPAPLLQDLSAWLDEEAGDETLQRACETARQQAINIAELLDWVQRYRCEPQRRTQALKALRAALGLAVIPGAVCRK